MSDKSNNIIDYTSFMSNPVPMPYTNNIPIYNTLYDNKYGKLSETAFMNFEPLLIENSKHVKK